MEVTSFSENQEKSPLILSGKKENEAPLLPCITWQHWMVGPASFFYVCAYTISLFTGGQYIYKKLQTEEFPNADLDSTISVCFQNTSSENYQMQVKVQEKASIWGIYFYMAGGVLTIFSNLILGSWTDRFGRKFLFIVPTIGTIIRTSLNLVLIYYNVHLGYFMFGYVVEGCTGQIFSIIQVSYIYMADITNSGKQRAIGIVVMEVVIGLGSSLPSLGTGYLLQATGFIWPFVVSLGMLVVSLIFMVILPETFAPEKRSSTYTSKLDNLRDAAGLYFSKKNAGRRWMYIITLTAFALYTYTLLGRYSVEGLYQLNSPFCWDPQRLGIFSALKGGLSEFVGIALVKLFHLCLSDDVIAIIGCVSYASSFVIEAFATSDTALYLVTVVGVGGIVPLPMIRAIMSRLTPYDKQGAVFASMVAMESTMSLLSAMSSNAIYLATVKFMRGFIFLLYAFFNVLCIILLVIFAIGTRHRKPVKATVLEVTQAD